MSAPEPFLQAFAPLVFGARSRRLVEDLGRAERLEDFYAACGELFPQRLLACQQSGPNSRERVFSPRVTFWAFVCQVLGARKSCRDIVRRVEAWWRWGQAGTGAPGVDAPPLSASAYCQARARLEPDTLGLIRRHLAWAMERRVPAAERGLDARVVKVLDGTTLSLPDTPANQARWPQPSSQKPGLGFPRLRLVGLFCLGSGALLEAALGGPEHEATLFRRQLLARSVQVGEVLLADRAFCSFGLLALVRARGADVVARLHQARSVDFRRGQRLGAGERLVEWPRPARRDARAWSAEEFAALPATLKVRLVRLRVGAPGFRTRTLVLATTLLDPGAYPAAALGALCLRRWEVELRFGELKTRLGMDVLRCKSPALVERELQVHLIAYNLVRALMQRAALEHKAPLGRLSFQGSLDALARFAAPIHAARGRPRLQAALIAALLRAMALDLVPARPGRQEPRARERRPKNFHLLTRPRHAMGGLPHRNRPHRPNFRKQTLS